MKHLAHLIDAVRERLYPQPTPLTTESLLKELERTRVEKEIEELRRRQRSQEIQLRVLRRG